MAGISLGPDEHLICSTQFGMLSVAVTKEQLKAQENDPDPHLLEEFDPRYHNGAHMIDGAISYLRRLAEQGNQFSSDICRSVGAYDYFTNTIGIDISNVFTDGAVCLLLLCLAKSRTNMVRTKTVQCLT
jgi:hypothetical protein